MNKDALLEAVKEAGRLAIFTAISVFVEELLRLVTAMPQNETLIVVLTIALRMIDKGLHEARKDKVSHLPSKSYGLLPF